ncbi:MAG: hypothetical protein PF636_01625 [Actinomycetota bacterium]|nr:hypothetical protein [Actinomycetota bacterium]
MAARLARFGILITLTTCIVLAAASVAFAYPNELVGYSGDEPRTECIDCHGASEQDILNPGSDPDLLAAVRKGPHGGYTTGTNKCQTCHSLHNAPDAGSKLLPGETVKNTCESCHDGTAGTAVYGVILARTGIDPASAHRIEQTNSIPGGDAGGGTLTGSFMGPGGTLTCSDCHAPHDSLTIEPFTGDRLRSTVASDTAYNVKTNRLLRQAPTGSETTATVYGAGWCATCHSGRTNQHTPESGAMQDHPVMQDDSYSYDELPVVTGVGSILTTLGGLGQSNHGYVMPGPTLSEPTQKTALQEGSPPLCQQCHEDARDVGPSARETNPTLTGASQEFQVTQPDGSIATDNPRFGVFPHESDNANLLVRAPEPAEPHSLCLNCHSLVHDATPGSDYVVIFAPQQHDVPEDYMTDPYTVLADCTICHTTELLMAHAQQCTVCHSSPYDTLRTWDGTCQQGGCHVAIHADSPEAHDPWSPSSGHPCGVCHGSSWWPTDDKCVNCHTLFSPSDVTAPVTSSDAVATYTGSAFIKFSITDSGKVGIGTTFYELNGGPTTSAGNVLITTSGAHSLEFWSIDQLGNVETAHKTATFTVTPDTTPPVTTSNAQATYNGSAGILLTATDNSSVGVKATYFQLDGAPTQTGTWVSVPYVVTDTQPHSLAFWSEDWSGNVETSHTVNFTVTPPMATIRMIWGDCDDPFPSVFPIDGSDASWVIRSGGSTGPIVATGYNGGNYPTWDGIDDEVVPVSATPYWVSIDWWDDDAGVGGTTTFPSVAASSAGWVLKLYY